MSTAGALAAFYRELIDGGMPELLAIDLVSQAGKAIFSGEGYQLIVKQTEPSDV